LRNAFCFFFHFVSFLCRSWATFNFERLLGKASAKESGWLSDDDDDDGKDDKCLPVLPVNRWAKIKNTTEINTDPGIRPGALWTESHVWKTYLSSKSRSISPFLTLFIAEETSKIDRAKNCRQSSPAISPTLSQFSLLFPTGVNFFCGPGEFSWMKAAIYSILNRAPALPFWWVCICVCICVFAEVCYDESKAQQCPWLRKVSHNRWNFKDVCVCAGFFPHFHFPSIPFDVVGQQTKLRDS